MNRARVPRAAAGNWRQRCWRPITVSVERFLGSHPAALKFVQTPKPAPRSFATEAYFGVTAMRFTNAEGKSRYGRYRIVPEVGIEHLTDEAAAKEGPNFLFDELTSRVAATSVKYRVMLQLAGEGDPVDDATIHWPEDRELVEVGHIVLTHVAPGNDRDQKQIIFDPIPRVDGIEPSDDPLLELRAAVYLISGRRRRQAYKEVRVFIRASFPPTLP